MPDLRNRSNRRVAVLIASWVLATSTLVLLGFADGNLVCDDGYYYYEIARNAALGQGFTFDSLGPTNGFHPLWACLLVPLFLLSPGSVWVPIHVSLILSAVFSAGTAWTIHALFVRNGSPEGGQIGAAIWLLNPFTLVLTFRGMEGPLNTFLIALLFLLLDSILRRATYTTGEITRLGIAMGLCLLARTDNILLLTTVSLVLAIELIGKRAWRVILIQGSLFLATAAALTLPWVAWNLTHFGTVVQTSFRSKRLFNLYGQLPDWLPADLSGAGSILATILGAMRNLALIAAYNAKYIVGEEWEKIDDGYVLLFAVLLVTIALALLPRFGRLRERLKVYSRSTVRLGPVGLFCLIHFLWYALIARNYYNWYFLPPVYAFSLFAGQRLGFLYTLGSRTIRWGTITGLALLVLTTPLILARHVRRPELHADEILFLQKDGVNIAPLPSGSRLGTWNAGARGYFASFHYPDRYVINLDGVVNNAIPRYVSKSSYEQYLLDHIDYLIETPTMMTWIIGSERTMVFLGRHLGPGRSIRKPDATREELNPAPG